MKRFILLASSFGVLSLLLAAQLVLATPIDDQLAETRARYSVVCGRFRADEIMFTGGCYLLKPSFLGLLRSIPQEILEFDPEKNVDDLLRAFLPRLFKFFEQRYPEYKQAVTDFYAMMNQLAVKLATGTKNVDMIDVDDAFEKSGMWQAKAELNANKTAMVALTANLPLNETNVILAPYQCDIDSLFCPYTSSVFGIVDTNNWNTLKISEVLVKAYNNSLKYINNSLVSLEAASKVFPLLNDLENLGTAQVKVLRIHKFLSETRYWPTLVNIFERESQGTTAEPTTTTKTTRTTTQRVKVIPKVAVTMEWYISVPTAVFVIGAVVATVMYLRSSNTNNQVIAKTQETAVVREVRQQQQQQPPIEMKRQYSSPEYEKKPLPPLYNPLPERTPSRGRRPKQEEVTEI